MSTAITLGLANGGLTRRAALAAAGAIAAALAFAPMGGTPSPAAERVTYLVRTAPGTAAEVAQAAGAAGVAVQRTLRAVDAVIVTATAGEAARLARLDRVAAVTPDAPMKANVYDATVDGTSLRNVQLAVGARAPWKAGVTGYGIDVAVIDSGVNRVKGLDGLGKVIYSPDFTPEATTAGNNVDGYGHGTHMAGIIAGQDPGEPVSNTNAQSFYGVAPHARIVSVKVADAQGNTTISAVITGLDWVLANRYTEGRNIQVANLAFGTDSTQHYTVDPLAYAAEKLWLSGTTVVVSAGNDGTALGRLDNPARDPFVIAVGASDTRGTASTRDDTVTAFSSRGDGTRNPDVVAPGRGIQSLRAPGSYVDVNHGATGALSERYFRGSGTSQSAAFVSGVAALFKQGRNWAPEQIKTALMSTAARLSGMDVTAQGAGQIHVPNAYNSNPLNVSRELPALERNRLVGRGRRRRRRGQGVEGQGVEERRVGVEPRVS
jgi:serine protease AprX